MPAALLNHSLLGLGVEMHLFFLVQENKKVTKDMQGTKHEPVALLVERSGHLLEPGEGRDHIHGFSEISLGLG